MAIARAIYQRVREYDGFVVIHGTDTMADTAAALTYMLGGLHKPIVLTGSQRSIWEPMNDARNNIYVAVQAATMDIGEVVVAFGNTIHRGTHAVKIDEEGYNAFGTPGVLPIGETTALRGGIRLFNHRIRRGPSDVRFFSRFDTKIFHYDPISGAEVPQDLLYLAKSTHNHALLLGSFGAGNLPDDMISIIKMARRHGKPVFVYTKCEIGAADMGIYGVGARPLIAGARPAGDMTVCCLAQKAMYGLGRAVYEKLKGDDAERFVNSIIQTPYNADITVLTRRT